MFENFNAELFDVDSGLCKAVRENDKEKVLYCLDNGASPDSIASDFPVLLTACLNGNVEIATILLDKGADANARNRYGWSALHEMVNKGESKEDLDLVDYLIEAAALVNRQDRSGETPLMTAIKKEKIGLIDVLMKRGGSVESFDKEKHYAVYHAIMTKNIEVIKKIVDADVLVTNKIDNLQELKEEIESSPVIKAMITAKYGDYTSVVKMVEEVKVVEEVKEVVVVSEEDQKVLDIKKTRKLGRA